jgi:hypothetical protein
MGRLYALGVRMRCPACGTTFAADHAWAQRRTEVMCPSCDAPVSLRALEMRRELSRVERDWARLWEDLRRNAEPFR